MSSTAFNPVYLETEISPRDFADVGQLVLEFGAPWCGHCQAATSSVESAVAARSAGLDDNGKIRHIRIYDGKGKKLGRLFGVKLWPTLILLQHGQEVARVVRPRSQADVNALWDGCCEPAAQ